MLKSNRLRNYSVGLGAGFLLALSIGVPLWTTATSSEEAIHRQADKAANQSHSGYIAVREKCSTIVTPAEKQECVASESKPYREAERNERDLEAQQVMANWTRVMGQTAIVGMGLGIISVLLIFVTFWETRKSADAASRNLEAFQKVESGTLVPQLEFHPGVGLCLVVSNVGKTLCKVLHGHADSYRFPDLKNYDTKKTFTIPLRGDGGTLYSGSVIQPGEKIRLKLLEPDTGGLTRVLGGIIYTNMFNEIMLTPIGIDMIESPQNCFSALNIDLSIWEEAIRTLKKGGAV